jgi:hypothetical protein
MINDFIEPPLIMVRYPFACKDFFGGTQFLENFGARFHMIFFESTFFSEATKNRDLRDILTSFTYPPQR